MPVTIRNYGAEDLAAFRAMWVELTAWHRQISGVPQIGGIDPGSKFDEHLACVGREAIWLATLGGEVVGMVGVSAGEGRRELEPIVVSAQWRGRGIGRRLGEHDIREARSGYA